jgi:hypothetical protein
MERGEDVAIVAVVAVVERIVVPVLGLVRGLPTRIVIDRLAAPRLAVVVSIIVGAVEATMMIVVAAAVAVIVAVPHWRRSRRASFPPRRLRR